MKRSLGEETTSSPFEKQNRKVRKSNHQVIIILDETIGSKLLYHKFNQTSELQLFLQHVPVLYWYPIQLIGTSNFKYDISECVFSAAIRNPLHQYSTGHLVTNLSDCDGDYYCKSDSDSEYGSESESDDIEEIYGYQLNMRLKYIQNFIKDETSSKKLRKLKSLLTSLVNDKLFIEQVTRKSGERSIRERPKHEYNYIQIYKSWTEGSTRADYEQMKDNEQIVLEVIKLGIDTLYYVSDRLKDNEQFMLKAIEQHNFSALRHASERLKDNSEFLSEVAKREVHALQYASNRLKDNFQFILQAVKQNGYALIYASKRLKNNEEIVLEAIKQDGYVLDVASKRFRNGEKYVLLAVKQNGDALCFTSDIFKDNEEIVLEAIKQNGCSIQFASERLKDNEAMLLEAVKQNGHALKYASKRFQDNEKIVLEAVKQNVIALSAAVRNPFHKYNTERMIKIMLSEPFDCDDFYLSDEIEEVNETATVLDSIQNFIMRDEKSKLHTLLKHLLNDKLFIKQVTSETDERYNISERSKYNDDHTSTWYADRLEYGDKLLREELGDDDRFVLNAVKEKGTVLECASNRLRDNEMIVLEAVKQDGDAFQYASERLQENEQILMEAIKQNGITIKLASDRFRDDEQFILEAVKQNGYSLYYASNRCQDNDKIVLLAVKEKGAVLECASNRLRDNESIVLEAVKQDGYALESASERLQDNEKIVLEAIKQKGEAIEYASERLQDNEILVLEAIKKNVSSLRHASERLRNDINFAHQIFYCCNTLDVFKYLGKELRNMEFIYYFIENYQSRFHELVRR